MSSVFSLHDTWFILRGDAAKWYFPSSFHQQSPIISGSELTSTLSIFCAHKFLLHYWPLYLCLSCLCIPSACRRRCPGFLLASFVLWFLALGKIPGSARSEFRQSGFVSANQCHRRWAPTLLLLLPTHCPHNMSGHWISIAGLKASTQLAENKKLWEVMTGCLI